MATDRERLRAYLAPLVGKPVVGQLQRHPDDATHHPMRVFYFWEEREDEGWDELMEDTFGDGFLEEYVDEDSRWVHPTQVPFAWLGEQVEGLLVIDLSHDTLSACPILLIEVDGTAMASEGVRQVSESLDALKLTVDAG